MTGFKNVPSVTAFAVGMEFWDRAGRKCRVLHVTSYGGAYGIRLADESVWGEPASEISHCTLDLDSIWVGREYRNKAGGPFAFVRMVSDSGVAWTTGMGKMKLCAFREEFLDRYEPFSFGDECACVVGEWSTKGAQEPLVDTRLTADDYLRGHRASGIKVGDRVKVLRRAGDGEGGWEGSWTPKTDDFIGKEFTVSLNLDKGGFALKGTNFAVVPYFILQKIITSPVKWEPRLREICTYRHPTTNEIFRAYPRGITKEWVWLCTPDVGGGEMGSGIVVRPTSLGPLLPAQAGDEVKVSVGQFQHYYGVMVEVSNWPDFVIKWATGRRGHTKHLTYGFGMTITNMEELKVQAKGN